MIAIYILLLLLIMWGISFCTKGLNEGYIDKEQCNAVKGIFIITVFVRHIMPYMQKVGYKFSFWGDALCQKIDKSMGQLLVVMFLFYSGYGVMESIKKKGNTYIDSMPRRRILKTIGNFDIAIIIFIITGLLVGREFDLTETLLAFTGWTAVENSNWYIFDILICYTAVWVSFKYSRWWMCILLIFVAFITLRLTKDSWWYNTLLSFPAGLFYSKYKQAIQQYIQSKYWCTLFISLITFLFLYKLPIAAYGMKDNAMSIAFAALFVILSMKVKIGNRVLNWLGQNLFPLYIYQRIPMYVFANIYGGIIASDYPLVYVSLCAIITLLFGRFFKYFSL